MFNEPPSSPGPFSKEELLENKLRAALSSFFESIGKYEGHEPAIEPRIYTLKALFSEIKNEEALQVIISESVASATQDKDEQVVLIKKLTSALERIDLIRGARG